MLYLNSAFTRSPKIKMSRQMTCSWVLSASLSKLSQFSPGTFHTRTLIWTVASEMDSSLLSNSLSKWCRRVGWPLICWPPNISVLLYLWEFLFSEDLFYTEKPICTLYLPPFECLHTEDRTQTSGKDRPRDPPFQKESWHMKNPHGPAQSSQSRSSYCLSHAALKGCFG